MKFAQDIIIKPIITENSMMGIADKKYTELPQLAVRY